MQIPTSCNGLTSILSREAVNIKALLISELKSRKSGCACTIDIWADTGISSYLGITLHYFDKNFELQSRFMGLKKLHYYHSGLTICAALEELLADWDLSLAKISKVVTDGAANMICALKNEIISEFQFLGIVSFFPFSGIPRETTVEIADNDDKEEDDDEFDDEEISDDDESFEYNLDENASPLTEEEMDFVLRITCIIHALVRVLCISVEKKSAILWKLVARVRRMIKFIRKSNKAKERFYEITKSTLLLPATTRWNSHFIMLNRFIKYWKEAAQVMREIPPAKKMAPFTAAEIDILTQLGLLLQKFQYAILDFQKHSITSSAVYGTIKDLLEVTSSPIAAVSTNPASSTTLSEALQTLKTAMHGELLKRFDKYVNIDAADFDPHFVLAAVFDPKQAICLHELQSTKIAEFVKKRLPKEAQIAIVSQEAPSNLSLRDKIAFSIKQQKIQSESSRNSLIIGFVKDMVEGKYMDRNSIDFWKNIPSDLVSIFLNIKTNFFTDILF